MVLKICYHQNCKFRVSKKNCKFRRPGGICKISQKKEAYKNDIVNRNT
jgi:hypothetical protein